MLYESSWTRLQVGSKDELAEAVTTSLPYRCSNRLLPSMNLTSSLNICVTEDAVSFVPPSPKYQKWYRTQNALVILYNWPSRKCIVKAQNGFFLACGCSI
ncbi:hypothetical protein QCA50_015097 [Cerrena zonata]|uniref:Uncharacterized protein n=1 Tax=Cerrena zonata TaxID=2478898 RepID=A0AAW0FK06_9APHY